MKRFFSVLCAMVMVTMATVGMAAKSKGKSEVVLANVDVAQAKKLIAKGVIVIDVREPSELAESYPGKIDSAVNIPLGSIAKAAKKLDPKAPYLIVCRSGNRSAKAAAFLNKAGFRKIYNLDGGMIAWAKAHK